MIWGDGGGGGGHCQQTFTQPPCFRPGRRDWKCRPSCPPSCRSRTGRTGSACSPLLQMECENSSETSWMLQTLFAMNHATYQRQGSNTFDDEKPFYSEYMANSTLWENYIFVSTWTASKVFDRIILHNFRYCVQQQVGTTKILTNFSIRILQLIRKNLNLFHRPEKHPSHIYVWLGCYVSKDRLGKHVQLRILLKLHYFPLSVP